MDPIPHTPLLPQNNFIWIELYGPPSFQAMNILFLELHTLFVLLFLEGHATCDKNLEQWDIGSS